MRFELDIQENWKNLRIRQIEFMISKAFLQQMNKETLWVILTFTFTPS